MTFQYRDSFATPEPGYENDPTGVNIVEIGESATAYSLTLYNNRLGHYITVILTPAESERIGTALRIESA